MLNLTVHRQNGTLIDSKDPNTSLYYDEMVEIRCESPRTCEMHLYVTISGSLHDRGHEYSVAIYDGNLPMGRKWSENVHIRHPRSPLQNPHLEVSITAKYNTYDEASADLEDENEPKERILVPFEPILSAKPSFLAPFKPSSGVSQSASAINYVSAYEEGRNSSYDNSEFILKSPRIPTNQKKPNAEVQGGIKVFRWKAPLSQAIELEMRSMRPALERVRVIAELNILAVVDHVRVKSCKVDMDDGIVELMGCSELPVTLEEGGIYAQCYNLQLRAAQHVSSSVVPIKPLSIIIECEVLSSQAENPCITTTWTPIVDFEGIQGPLPKTPAIHIPTHSPMFGGNSAPGSGVPGSATVGGIGSVGMANNASSSTLDIVGGRRASSSTNLSLMNGLSIFITGPQFVKVGEVFTWKFQAMSRSQRERTFSMTFGDSSQAPLRNDYKKPHDLLLAYSTYDEDQLRTRMASHYAATDANCGIIPLCNGFSVGKLAPQGSFETHIKLKALKAGTHTIESSRIRDLASGDSYDVGALLDVIVQPN